MIDFDAAGRHPDSFLTLTISRAFIHKVNKGRGMAKKTYYEKLKDPKWQKKRLEVMQVHDFTCELCGDNKETLNVHHKEYFKGLDPWEYAVNQLACLCETCHEAQHLEVDILKLVCSYARLDGPENRTELALLLAGFMGIEQKQLEDINPHFCAPYLKDIYKDGVRANKAGCARTAKRIKERSEF